MHIVTCVKEGKNNNNTYGDDHRRDCARGNNNNILNLQNRVSSPCGNGRRHTACWAVLVV